jgi:hypothetical protein
MKRLTLTKLCWLIVAGTIAVSGDAQAADVSSGTLLQFDFNDVNPWPQRSAAGAGASVEVRNVGTIDAAGSRDASGGLLLAVNRAAAKGEWAAALNSGPIAVQNKETNLGKLTLSFSLSTSMARPVKVRVESFNGQKQRTGGLEVIWDPSGTGFTAIKDAYFNNTVIGIAAMDGAIATTGSQGLWADCMITDFSREEPLEEAISVKVTAKPTYSANAPIWKTVSGS